MSDNVWDDNDGLDSQVQGKAQANKALRDLHDQDRQRIQDLESKLAEVLRQSTEVKVSSLLESHGLNPKVAKFYQGDADPAAVAAWAEENKAFFGGTTSPPPQEQSPAPLLNQQQQDEYEQMLSAGVDGVKPTHYNDALAALQAAKTREELQEVYRRFG